MPENPAPETSALSAKAGMGSTPKLSNLKIQNAMVKKIKGRPRSADPCGTASIRTPAVEIRHVAGYLAYHLGNWMKYAAKLVRIRNGRIRSTAIREDMRRKYGMTFCEEKRMSIRKRCMGRIKQLKYTVYEAVKTVQKGCTSLRKLAGD